MKSASEPCAATGHGIGPQPELEARQTRRPGIHSAEIKPADTCLPQPGDAVPQDQMGGVLFPSQLRRPGQIIGGAGAVTQEQRRGDDVAMVQSADQHDIAPEILSQNADEIRRRAAVLAGFAIAYVLSDERLNILHSPGHPDDGVFILRPRQGISPVAA